MVRIIHLSDFHLNPDTLSDWNRYVKSALVKKLDDLHAESPVQLIAFTGDLLDAGGKSYPTASAAFNLFSNEVITPIVTSLGLPKERFLMVPGNHDVTRSSDSDLIESGLRSGLTDATRLDRFVKDVLNNTHREGVNRIEAYSQFAAQFYKDAPDCEVNYLGAAFRINVGGIEVGVACLNSAWRCYAQETDHGQLLIGEEQLHRASKFIESCPLKIGLIHHPLDWLSLAERSLLTNFIAKDFNILLCGHVHESHSLSQTGFAGTLFSNICPSGLYDLRNDSRKYANGFSVVDYDSDKKQISCTYLRYSADQRKFVLNTEAGNEGYFQAIVPDALSAGQQKLEHRVLAHVKEEHFPEMDKHLMSGSLDVERKPLSEVFVFPPITQADKHYDEHIVTEDIGLNDIFKSESNMIFFGNQEVGKTVLLYRLVVEFVNQHELLGCIPVYVRFDELETRDLASIAKAYLGCSAGEWTMILESTPVVLLVDDMDFEPTPSNAALRRLNRFIGEYANARVIATATNRLPGTLPEGYLEHCSIPFKSHFIKHLQAKEIKDLISCWVPAAQGIERDVQLDKLVRNFESYSLPSTPMSVSLFLWSMHNSTRKPINQAVLMEIYIEIVLEKLHEHNVYRDSLDFTNKLQLIARIAHDMLLKEQADYSMSYGDFVQSIEAYLRTMVGFTFDSKVIADYLLEKRIFTKYAGTRIRFSYSCFFNFFLAKRMEFDHDFKDYVLDKDRYYLFHREIDIYTGLTRSDVNLFKIILERFEEGFKRTDPVLQLNYDKLFPKITESKARALDLCEVKTQRPDEAGIDAFYDSRLRGIPSSAEILKKEGHVTLDLLLLVMSNVLRNSEGVEDLALKKKAYESLVKYCLAYTVVYRDWVINYVRQHKALPKPFVRHTDLWALLVNMPLYVQMGMNQHLGTKKLAPVIDAKINQDRLGNSITGSEIEAFMSVALYADIEGPDFDKRLKRFIKGVKSNVVRDFCMDKLLDYYYRRTRPGSPNEDMYLDMLATLRIKSQRLPARMRDTVVKNLKDSKTSFLKKLGS